MVEGIWRLMSVIIKLRIGIGARVGGRQNQPGARAITLDPPTIHQMWAQVSDIHGLIIVGRAAREPNGIVIFLLIDID